MSNRRKGGRSSLTNEANRAVEEHHKNATSVLFDSVKKQYSLVARDDGTVQAGKFNLTATGIDLQQLSRDVTEEDWQRLGDMLVRLAGSIQWLIGDWLIIGEQLFAHGDIKKVAEKFAFDEDYFYDVKSVANKVPYANRLPDLSFGHHRAVRARVSDQRDWLLQARTHGWTVSELRRQIRIADGGLPEPEVLRLTNRDYNKSFQRIMTAIRHQKPISRDDVDLIEGWLRQIKKLPMDG